VVGTCSKAMQNNGMLHCIAAGSSADTFKSAKYPVTSGYSINVSKCKLVGACISCCTAKRACCCI
jgi:hypothetical protein